MTILHEAAHLLVGLVSPGHATPPDIGTSSGDAGFQFERSLLGGIATVEISKFALFDVSKMQRLLLRSDGFFEIIGEYNGHLIDLVLRVHLQCRYPNMPSCCPPVLSA